MSDFDNEFRQGYKGMRDRLAESNWTAEQASIALERWRERVSTPYNLGAKKAVEDYIDARKPAEPSDPNHLAALADGSWTDRNDWCPPCHAAGLKHRHQKCHAASGLKHRDLG